jgi:hypothetical protein
VEASGYTTLNEGELTLKADNPLFNRPGFARIPVEEIGLYQDSWRGEARRLGREQP